MTLSRPIFLAALAATLLTACAASGTTTRTAAKPDAALAAVLAGPQRTAEQKERDGERRPAASLAFWGLQPGASILEVQPGGGWWTQILAPYAARTGGRYTATAADLTNPNLTPAARQGREAFAARYADAGTYGKVELVDWGPVAPPLKESQYDFILLSRVIHGWMRTDGMVDKYFAQVARVGGSVQTPNGWSAVSFGLALTSDFATSLRPARFAASITNCSVA